MMATRPSPMLPIAMVVTALAIAGLIVHTVITYDTYEGPPAPATCGLSTCNPKCGDGTRWGSEVCDDGMPASFDGCSDKCKVECGYKCTGGSTTAPDECEATCGDGILAFGAETCDDGNTADGDGCSALCAVESTHECKSKNCTSSTCKPKCGDGTRFGDEVCDDGMPGSGDGCSDKCKVECGYKCTGGSTTAPDECEATCGDGILAFGAETCDDGNTADGDGCSALCAVESTHVCTDKNCTSSTCKPKCGDGTRFGAEVCDDGMPSSGDGCSDKCTVECGWTCEGGSETAPDECKATCGDGMTVGAEACDDGNTQDGDGCSATCTKESTHECKLPDPAFKWKYWMTVVLVSCVVVLTWAAVLVQYMMAGKQDKTTPLPSTKSDTTTSVVPIADPA